MTAQELKNSILQLAIQGKLVPQNNSDEPASELLKRIHSEKERLLQEGKIKREKPLPRITEEEIPFEIPSSWAWVRLGEIIKVVSGTSYKASNVSKAGVRIFRGGNIQDTKIIYHDDDVFLPIEFYDEEKTLHFGDIVIVASTGSRIAIGKPGFVDHADSQTQIGAFLRIVRPTIFDFLPYLKVIFSSDFYRKHIRDSVQGMNINNIKEEHLSHFVVPLPPLEEQKQIVAKIEELMPLVEEYGKAEKELSALNAEFPEQLRKSILQLAVQGKLVPQNKVDEPASELLKRIRAEKERLTKEGIIKREKPLPSILEDEIPFEIPSTWQWVRLNDIVSALGDGIHGTPNYCLDGEYYFINGNNLCDGEIVFKADTLRVNKEEYVKYKKPLNQNTILLSINGTIGNIAFYKNEPVILGKSACYVTLLDEVNKYYINVLLQTQMFYDYAVREATQTTIKNVSLKAVRMLPVPLPPIEEQARIVARVEELLAVCDRLQ